MTKKQRWMLKRICYAGLLFAAGMLLPYMGGNVEIRKYMELVFFTVSYLLIGWDVVWKAIHNIRQGQIFDETFLMMVATFGAFALGEYSEGTAVMLFYQVGEWFQSYAVAKSRKSIASLMDIRPDYANVERNGQVVEVDPESVAIGESIIVKPGERVPLDGVILRGNSNLDTSALTGESLPRAVGAGMDIISGCINQSGTLQIRTTKDFRESTVAKILDMVENSSAKKAKTENFITRFARYYTPAVVIAAILLASFPPLLWGQDFSIWIYRALTFLVISCPCALVISIPLSFFGGLGGASKCGVLVKGSNYLEALADTKVIVFDKTGTLTQGKFAVTEIKPVRGTRNELLEIAAYAEGESNHPIAVSIRNAYGQELRNGRIKDVQEIAGQGVRLRLDGRRTAVGNARFMQCEHVVFNLCEAPGTVIYVAVDGRFMGHLLIEDEVKKDAAQAIRDMKINGIEKTVMLTGDSQAVGQKVAIQLQLDQFFTQLMPADKVAQVETLLQNLKERKDKAKLAFVGDGINDAPVLARADVGIAMGALGSDAAIEAADVVLMTDEPSKIVIAIKIARKTLGIARQNIVFAIGVKLFVLVLGAIGYASMWAAVFADVGVSVLAILNAIRAMRVKGLLEKDISKENAYLPYESTATSEN